MSHDNYSLSARVYNHIRDGILAGTFAKGDELKEKNIGDELGVSRTPVREALRQLELEGLVSIIPKVTLGETKRAKNSTHEHKQICEAIKNHDALLAEKCAREHINNSKENMEHLGWENLIK